MTGGGLWPPGWSRGRRAALLVVDGVALWVTALLFHLYNNPATWNVARSTSSEIVETVQLTTLLWITQPTPDAGTAFAYLGGLLVLIGVGWYGLLRPVVERYTSVVKPISDPTDESRTP